MYGSLLCEDDEDEDEVGDRWGRQWRWHKREGEERGVAHEEGGKKFRVFNIFYLKVKYK